MILAALLVSMVLNVALFLTLVECNRARLSWKDRAEALQLTLTAIGHEATRKFGAKKAVQLAGSVVAVAEEHAKNRALGMRQEASNGNTETA